MQPKSTAFAGNPINQRVTAGEALHPKTFGSRSSDIPVPRTVQTYWTFQSSYHHLVFCRNFFRSRFGGAGFSLTFNPFQRGRMVTIYCNSASFSEDRNHKLPHSLIALSKRSERKTVSETDGTVLLAQSYQQAQPSPRNSTTRTITSLKLKLAAKVQETNLLYLQHHHVMMRLHYFSRS